MAKKQTAKSKKITARGTAAPGQRARTSDSGAFPSYCSLPEVAPRQFSPDVPPGRLELIVVLDSQVLVGAENVVPSVRSILKQFS